MAIGIGAGVVVYDSRSTPQSAKGRQLPFERGAFLFISLRCSHLSLTNCIYNAVLDTLLRSHPMVAIKVFHDLLEALTAILGKDLRA